jgi:hypothetical protein
VSEINDMIRAAAGRGPAIAARADEEQGPAEGDLGVGRGAGAAPPSRRRDSRAINDALRAAAHRVTHRLDVDGVELDDVLGDA